MIIGNWKMHKTIAEAVAFVKALEQQLQPELPTPYLAIPFTAIRACASYAVRSVVGAQNMHEATHGAFTGEISAPMLIDAGAHFVLLGHSERRHLMGETDAFIQRKLHRALETPLRPVLCVGETLDEHEADRASEVIVRQLEIALRGVEDLKGLSIAYEPVWAIGTGKTATPEQAQQVHQCIRNWCQERWSAPIPILYGGSVQPGNAASLLGQPDIDGLLVGGASLSLDSFLKILSVGRAK
jgi:triosephosphate isomerase